jgi:hypothetical protein
MIPLSLTAFLPLAILLGTVLIAGSISAFIALAAPAQTRRAAPRRSAEILPFPVTLQAGFALHTGQRPAPAPTLRAG